MCRCENVHNDTGECERRALQGDCDTDPGFMMAKCSKTCLGCGYKHPGILTLRRSHLPRLELRRLYVDLVWCYKTLLPLLRHQVRISSRPVRMLQLEVTSTDCSVIISGTLRLHCKFCYWHEMSSVCRMLSVTRVYCDKTA